MCTAPQFLPLQMRLERASKLVQIEEPDKSLKRASKTRLENEGPEFVSKNSTPKKHAFYLGEGYILPLGPSPRSPRRDLRAPNGLTQEPLGEHLAPFGIQCQCRVLKCSPETASEDLHDTPKPFWAPNNIVVDPKTRNMRGRDVLLARS